jgi:hypothetical protein
VSAAAPIPARMSHLPRDVAGRPVPWFVPIVDGVPDPRLGDEVKFVAALRFRKCWVCGATLGRYVAFVVGPMCAVNRISADPGCHRDCAVYSATACPFLATPQMRRRTDELTAERGVRGGVMIRRNPGVVAVWVTRRFEVFKAGGGPLISLGDPDDVLWFHRGQPATAEQALAGLESGLPALRETCDAEDDPQAAHAELDRQVAAARRLFPAAAR